MPCVLKYLTPEAMASAVIGKGGAVVAAMRQMTGAKIGLTEHSDLYPGTDCRILTAQANTEDALFEVSAQIIAKVAECVQTAPSEQLGQPGELRLRALVPRAAVGGLIGKGGAVIKQLRESSGAKVNVGECIGNGPGADQTVSISGSQQAVELVMGEINRQVQAVNKEPWFQEWASGAGLAAAGPGAAPAPARRGGNGHAAPNGPAPGGRGGAVHAPMAVVPSLGGAANGGNGMDTMFQVAQTLPQYVVEDPRGFAMSCVVPNRLVGGLIGRGGSGTKEVQQITGTKIGIREIPGDSENRSMNIAGPLASACAAFMLMMRRYLDAEAQAATAPAPQVAQGQGRR